jgi:hypothetical protein
LKALCLYAGPTAYAHLQQHGLQPRDVRVIPAAAGGPKGLVLGRLDRFLFGDWLRASAHTIHLVGASIGAWRMTTACLKDPLQGFDRLEQEYIFQHYDLPPGRKMPTPDTISRVFGGNLKAFYAGREAEVLQHPCYKLHIITSRGRHLLARDQALRTPLGFVGAYLANALRRKTMGAWLERVVFSSQHARLPFRSRDYPTRQCDLTAQNLVPALLASCSIPFVLRAVHDIPGAPPGAYWDGGLTDYHLHLQYLRPKIAMQKIAARADGISTDGLKDIKNVSTAGLVLYPHFQKAVVPGWLDKRLTWRHKSSSFLDNMLVLAPNPDWVTTLPNGKLPDRADFRHYGLDLSRRAKAWTGAIAASQQMADEFAEWLLRPDMGQVQAL